MKLAWTLLQQACLVLAQAILSQKNLDLSRGLGQRISPFLVLIYLNQKPVLFRAVDSAIYPLLKLFRKELAVTEQQDSKKTLMDSGKAEERFLSFLHSEGYSFG